MTAAFALQLRRELQLYGLIDNACARAARIVDAGALGEQALAEVERVVGAATVRHALAARRGVGYPETYRYVMGYGQLMTQFLAAPVRLEPDARARIARLGGLANLIVAYFDEMVDGGWPRVLLLPRWALAMAPRRAGRALLYAGAPLAPAPARLVARLVAEYFRRVAELPHSTRWARARADLCRAIAQMYDEEGRTPRELRRLRGGAARQKKTALPLVVLGLPAWLASPVCSPDCYARHRRWLYRIGKFIRWIDDAADLSSDESAGAPNLVRRALARAASAGTGAMLARMIARRGRCLLEEWWDQVLNTGDPSVADAAVLDSVLMAWLGAPDLGHSQR